MTGLTQADLIIGTYILMAIVGVETGIIVGLIQRAGSLRNLFKLIAKPLHDDGNQTTKKGSDTAENPQVEEKRVESGHP